MADRSAQLLAGQKLLKKFSTKKKKASETTVPPVTDGEESKPPQTLADGALFVHCAHAVPPIFLLLGRAPSPSAPPSVEDYREETTSLTQQSSELHQFDAAPQQVPFFSQPLQHHFHPVMFSRQLTGVLRFEISSR